MAISTLTVEDRSIFTRMSVMTEAQYRYADNGDALRTAAYLRSGLGIVEGVSLQEVASRAAETGRWP